MPNIAAVVALHDDTPEAMVHALADQTVRAPDLEVVIVDGWHRPRSWEAAGRGVEAVAGRLPVRLLRIPRSGRAAAWNRGIAETTAPLVLLLADDFVATTGLVEHHLRLHERRPDDRVVGLGPALFPPELRSSPFIRWLEDEGRLFGVSFSRPDLERLAAYFYGANTSLKRALLDRVGPFEEAFPHHGYDDYEMGLRLRRAGMEVEFLPEALAFHPHDITVADRIEVMRESAESVRILEELHPGEPSRQRATRVPAWVFGAEAVARRAALAITGSDAARGRYYSAVLRHAFVAAYRGSRRRGARRPGLQ